MLTRDAALNKKLKTLNVKSDFNEVQQNNSMVNYQPQQQQFSPEYQPTMVHQQFSPNQQFSSNFASSEFINAEEIFQLDQPIKQYSIDQMYSRSPSTVLDLDQNYLVKNELSVVTFPDGYERDDTMSLTSGSSASLFDDAYCYVDNNYLQPNYAAQEFNNNNFYGKSFYADDVSIYDVRPVNDSVAGQANYTKCEVMLPALDQHQNYSSDYKAGGFNYGIYEESSPFVHPFEQCAF